MDAQPQLDFKKAPKLDFKMLALPAVFFFSRKIDFTDPNIVRMAQAALMGVAVLVLTIHFYVYSRITTKKNTKKIWVPPKPKPSLPFVVAEPPKVEDYEETTYTEYEIKVLKESVQSIVMSLAISLFMSMKFNIHMSLLMQAVTIPLNCIDSIVLKKYILGADESSMIYGESFTPPTEATLAAAAGEGSSATAALGPDDPRVEELDEQDDVDSKKKVASDSGDAKTTIAEEVKAQVDASPSSSSSGASAKPTTTAADEVD